MANKDVKILYSEPESYFTPEALAILNGEEINLESAKRIIKEYDDVYNRVNIYKQCYVFCYDDGDDNLISIKDGGGIHPPRGVVKKTGRIVPFPELLADGIARGDELEEAGIIIDLKV